MRLVVGLGNPGPQYRNHRHNVGFMVADRLHARASASEWKEKYLGFAARGILAGQEVVLLKPQTFMNVSGRAVQKALAQLGLGLADLLVVHDDIELAFAELRCKLGGGHGGHNGLRDIIQLIGADYARIRLGVGRPAAGAVNEYVLSPFPPDEVPQLDDLLERATNAAGLAIDRGIEEAILEVNPPNAGGRKKRR